MSRDQRELDLGELAEVVAEQAYPLLFATVSGAHLYGFASRDSDVDLRGVHLLPLAEVIGLRVGPETVTSTFDRAGSEVDLVSHDVAKFCRLLLRRNGYVLEQLLSPLVVTTTAAHDELRALAPGCLTRHHAEHYLGFARTQRALAERTGELKPLLYTVRVLLTGVHLMRTHEVLAHLPTLVERVPEAPGWVREAVALKAEAEHAVPPPGALPTGAPLARELERLAGLLVAERDRSALPDAPSAQGALHDLLVRLRLG